MIWLPTPVQVNQVHHELVAIFARDEDPISPSGVRSEDLLVSACQRPNVGLGSTEKYTTVFSKAAALFHSLTKNHAFHNGNKRTALVALLSMLQRNGYQLDMSVSDDDVYELVLSVAADTFPAPSHGLSTDQIVEQLASWLRIRSDRKDPKVSSMSLRDFVFCCEQAGARTRTVKGGAVLIRNGRRSIRISRSTPRLHGHAIVKYLSTLGLPTTGLSPSEFQKGASPERQQIYRFMAALRRLSKS